MGMNNTKIYFKQGGDELVVGSGAKIVVEAGGDIEGVGDISAVNWTNLPSKPAVIAAGADEAAARAAIDAAVDTHDHAVDEDDASGLAAAADIQALAIALSARIKAVDTHDHAVVEDAESGLAAAADIQALAIALSTRIKALEDAAGG